jgi:hypothetical protein
MKNCLFNLFLTDVWYTQVFYSDRSSFETPFYFVLLIAFLPLKNILVHSLAREFLPLIICHRVKRRVALSKLTRTQTVLWLFHVANTCHVLFVSSLIPLRMEWHVSIIEFHDQRFMNMFVFVSELNIKCSYFLSVVVDSLLLPLRSLTVPVNHIHFSVFPVMEIQLDSPICKKY